MPERTKRPRLVACARCFRLKRKCDHAKPKCSECLRKGAECLPAASRKDGDTITIPLKYLKELESRVAELETSHTSSITESQVCDIGVQTEPIDEASNTGSYTSLPNDWMANLLEDPISYHSSSVESDQPSNAAIETGSALMLLPNSRRPARRPEDCCAMDIDMTLLLQADTIPLDNFVFGSIPWPEDLYTNLYFSITDWEWPFLNQSAWKSWRSNWEIDKSSHQWKGFYLQMVYAIGALLCNNLQHDPSHSARARGFYASAMAFYPHVISQASSVHQIQASLLLILYALHCPWSDEIVTSVSSIVPFCAATMTEIRKLVSASAIDETDSSSDLLTDKLFITCYMLNEVVVSGWDRPVSAAYRAIDDDLYSYSNDMPPSDTNTALNHLFQLRKIQASIRRYWDQTPRQQYVTDTHQDAPLKTALETWKKDISRYGLDDAPYGQHHPLWMSNLYNYSVIILIQEKRGCLRNQDVEYAFSAIVDVCISYRHLQEEGQVMCYTWSSLVFQFRAGIMLLYIFWATSHREHEHIQQALGAVYACANTLSHFADRWEDAIPYKEVFKYLIGQASWISDSSAYPVEPHGCTFQDLEGHLGNLKKKYIHKAVLEMIEDMVYERCIYDVIDDDCTLQVAVP